MDALLMARNSPGILLTEKSHGNFSTVLYFEDGSSVERPAISPAEDLIAATEFDYKEYRRRVQGLWDEHPLFEERPIIRVKEPESMEGVSEADFHNFVIQACRLPGLLREIDPVGYHVVREHLNRDWNAGDDGSAMFLLNTGARILKILWEPIRVQVCLRNIFEMAFDGMERATQQEQFEKLRSVYPDVGFSCKQRGARFQRNQKKEQDKALLICDQLRDRIYNRYRRYTEAAPFNRERLLPVDDRRFDEWSENARIARLEYRADKITSEEFLRRIDTTHELTSYEADKAELITETRWQRMVAHDLTFDPATHYPSDFQFLDLRKHEPRWEAYTADDFRRYDQQGHQSLRKNCGKRCHWCSGGRCRRRLSLETLSHSTTPYGATFSSGRPMCLGNGEKPDSQF